MLRKLNCAMRQKYVYQWLPEFELFKTLANAGKGGRADATSDLLCARNLWMSRDHKAAR